MRLDDEPHSHTCLTFGSGLLLVPAAAEDLQTLTGATRSALPMSLFPGIQGPMVALAPSVRRTTLHAVYARPLRRKPGCSVESTRAHAQR